MNVESTIEIKPVRELDAVVRVPGSKSYTNRALITAALADGKSTIKNALFSDDTQYMATALNKLGISIEEHLKENAFVVHGLGGHFPVKEAKLFVGNAGTAMRFLTALLTLAKGTYEIDGVERMRNRPVQDLIDCLNRLGADVSSKYNNGCPPVLIKPKVLVGGRTKMKGNLSSQYFSAILLTAPYSRTSTQLTVIGDLVSKPYIDMTINLMNQFGVEVENMLYKEFLISANQKYKAIEYEVEADASSASYFLAAAAIAGGRVRVEGLNKDSLQGDVRIADILEQMGCIVSSDDHWIEIQGGELRGIDVDLKDTPDIAQTLAAVAVFADGKTRVRNVRTLRIKETDRISGVVTEMQKLGVTVKEFEDGFEIERSEPKPGIIETYGDHRMAMSFSLIGLRTGGIKIKDPGCVSKTFPSFFEELGRLKALR
ncbi:MAG TPA: 3-phosphoshikimate 1-carboxyvinyltransferase [Candidatus Brocadiia bacterium]|nr:3-phosphoshikimate 1-carboxyvinyltransferase [Candidatus Brocadiales bacterium]